MRKVHGNARVRYREHPVPGHLRHHLACLWELEDPAPPAGVQTIYPDGCCELIVHLGSPPRSWDEASGWHEQATSLFASQHLRPVRLEATGALHCLGLRLQPEASCCPGLRPLPINRILDLAGVDASLSRALHRAMRDFVGGKESTLWKLMETSIARDPVDAVSAHAVALLRASDGGARIESVARKSGASVRSLQLRFRRHVGLSPKEFGRMMRLRATLRALESEEASVAEVAADRGFADQAHAARELRRTTGLAPAKLRAALRADRGGDTAIHLAAAFLRGASR